MGKQKDGDGANEPRTTVAVYTTDALDLKQLAAMLDMSAADVYRRLVVPVVKTALLAEVRRKAIELGKDR